VHWLLLALLFRFQPLPYATGSVLAPLTQQDSSSIAGPEHPAPSISDGATSLEPNG